MSQCTLPMGFTIYKVLCHYLFNIDSSASFYSFGTLVENTVDLLSLFFMSFKLFYIYIYIFTPLAEFWIVSLDLSSS